MPEAKNNLGFSDDKLVELANEKYKQAATSVLKEFDQELQSANAKVEFPANAKGYISLTIENIPAELQTKIQDKINEGVKNEA